MCRSKGSTCCKTTANGQMAHTFCICMTANYSKGKLKDLLLVGSPWIQEEPTNSITELTWGIIGNAGNRCSNLRCRAHQKKLGRRCQRPAVVLVCHGLENLHSRLVADKTYRQNNSQKSCTVKVVEAKQQHLKNTRQETYAFVHLFYTVHVQRFLTDCLASCLQYMVIPLQADGRIFTWIREVLHLSCKATVFLLSASQWCQYFYPC